MNDMPGHSHLDRREAAFSMYEFVTLIAAAVVLIAFRLHAFDLPLETDECNYAVIGGRLLAGDHLYVDVWDHQPFGVFALFAAAIAFFGDAPVVFRCLALTSSLVSLGLVHAIARRCGGRFAGVAAAILFAMVSADPGSAGEGCNREIFMNTLILAAWFVALRSEGTQLAWIAVSGVLLALASSIKTIVAVHWLILALWIVMIAWRQAGRGGRFRRGLVCLAVFGAGPAVFWLGALVYFAGTHRLREFVDAVFLFNLGYSASSEAFWMRFLRFFAPERHPYTFDSALPVWIGGLLGLTWLVVLGLRGRRVQDWAVVLLSVASYLAVCLPGRFWPHYYYLLIPCLVLCFAVAVGSVGLPLGKARPDGMRSGVAAVPGGGRNQPQNASIVDRLGFIGQRSRPARVLRIGVFSVIFIWLAVTVWGDYLSQPPFGITVKRYNSRDFWGRGQGENVARVTDPQDEIFVYGNEAEIYYYSKRRCASRFTMITGIGEGYPGADKRRTEMMNDLRRNPPRVILVMFDENPFEAWKAFMKFYYGDPVGWDFNDRTGKPIMFVVVRKDAPIESIDWNWDRSSVGGWMRGAR